MNNQRGFIDILVIVGVVLFVAATAYFTATIPSPK